MKKNIQSIGYVAFLLTGTGALIKAVNTYKNPFSLYENPLVWLLLIALIFVVIVKEYFNLTIQKLREDLQNEKDGITIEKVDSWKWVKDLNKKLTKTRAIEEENEIILDHEYDGIRELDNVLPPWWVYLFYATIFFAMVYLVRYQIMGGNTPENEYQQEVALARIELEKYKKDTPNVFDVSKVTLLTDESSLETGKTIFRAMCAACHAGDAGGGIGPNLTDEYWILGGGIKNVFNTIQNGGRDGKGMIAWGKTIKPQNIQKIASYILSLQGTTPVKPKKAQGEIWKDESEKEAQETVVIDSLQQK